VSIIIGIPILVLLVILQSTVISRLNLSYGSADIVMLVLIALGLQNGTKRTILWFAIGGLLVSIISAVPLMYPLMPYLIIGLILEYIRKRVWKIPLLMMIIISFVGTLIYTSISYLIINFSQVPLPLTISIVSVFLPSAALNVALGIPIYLLVSDWSSWLNPKDEE
jgi:hypothetical protein